LEYRKGALADDKGLLETPERLWSVAIELWRTVKGRWRFKSGFEALEKTLKD
jgi:hypothetical protein